jgi:hypothetical protein
MKKLSTRVVTHTGETELLSLLALQGLQLVFEDLTLYD